MVYAIVAFHYIHIHQLCLPGREWLEHVEKSNFGSNLEEWPEESPESSQSLSLSIEITTAKTQDKHSIDWQGVYKYDGERKLL